MKDKILFMLMFLLSTSGFSATLDEGQAMKIARSIVARNTRIKSDDAKDADLKLAYKSIVEDIPTYYVFNKSSNNGYLIISADDATESLIGYSDNGYFDYNSIPSNMKWWLCNYEKEIEYIRKAGVTTVGNNSTGEGIVVVSPLLKNILWNQDSPFNDNCPAVGTETTTAGCVAIAMAQTMNYYKWPEKGVGNKNYLWNGETIGADFGVTTYQWDKIADTYTSSNSQDSKDAVATLVYHCGIAVNMDYGVEGSSAFSENIPNALSNYFNYDKGVMLLYREYYGRGEWEDVLKKELNGNRPIIYGGQSEYDGHSFVCDGYDSNNMFHFNWGWRGNCNGYFKISLLTPDIYSDGLQAGGFNYNQEAIVGIQKPVQSSTTPTYLVCSGLEPSKTVLNRGESLTINNGSITNLGGGAFVGKYGVALYRQSDDKIVSSSSVKDIEMAYRTVASMDDLELPIPADLPEGSYEVRGVSIADGSTMLMRTSVTNPMLLLVAKGDECSISYSKYAKVAITNLTLGEAYRNRLIDIAFDATGSENEYYGYFNVSIIDKATKQELFCSSKIPADIIDGETVNVKAQIETTLAAGDYQLTIIDKYGDQLISPLDFSLKESPQDFDLVINGITFDDATKVDGDNFHAIANMSNKGGYFNNGLNGLVYDMDKNYKRTIPLTLSLKENETKDMEINAVLGLQPGEYMLCVATAAGDIVPGNNWQRFTIISGAGVEKVSKSIKISLDASHNVIMVYVDGNIGAVKVINLQGNILIDEVGNSQIDISNLPAGLYFLQLTIDNILKTIRFVK